MDILEKIPYKSNQAVVFDIDDTLISSENGKLIPKVYEIYNYCRNKGYIIYIITARGGTSYVINITRRQLHSLGITGYKKVFFRHPMDLMVAKYKKNIRKDIPENIIMSIGDQPGDIGEYGGYGLLVKRPKPTPSFFQSLLTFI